MSTTPSFVLVIRSFITKMYSFLSIKGAYLRQSVVKINSYVVIKYFLIFAVTKQDSFGWWTNNCLSALDKFKREYQFAATGRTGNYTSERLS